jgi:hypothetical protein
MMDYDDDAAGNAMLKVVQITDLEDSVVIPPGKNLKGCVCGNAMWRSPEAWVRGSQNTASDIFSFAILVRIPFRNSS